MHVYTSPPAWRAAWLLEPPSISEARVIIDQEHPTTVYLQKADYLITFAERDELRAAPGTGAE